jgi:anti-sigma B factor antagonist
METTVRESDASGFETILVKGECDLYSAPAFARSMLARLAQGPKRLRFDLSELYYLDSTGVGAIIRILQEARKRGCELRFRGIEGSPRKVLKMSNILSLMREEATP